MRYRPPPYATARTTSTVHWSIKTGSTGGPSRASASAAARQARGPAPEVVGVLSQLSKQRRSPALANQWGADDLYPVVCASSVDSQGADCWVGACSDRGATVTVAHKLYVATKTENGAVHGRTLHREFDAALASALEWLQRT